MSSAPKVTKTKASAKSATPAAAATPAAPPAATKAKKVKAAAAVVETPVDVSASVEVSAPAPVASTDVPVSELSAGYYSKLTQLGSVIAALKSEFKALEKKYAHNIKMADKMSSKKSKKRRVPAVDANGVEIPDHSGFKKPTQISSELAAFFSMPAGSLMARTEATKGITKYVKAHSLQRESNRRIIEVHNDATLQALLRVPVGTELSYFNLQKFMTAHFAKKGDSAFVNAYV